MNPYREYIKNLKSDTVEIRIHDFGMYEALPITVQLYKQLLNELGTPEAVSEVVLQLVALLRLQGADISEEKILAMESELLNIYNAGRRERREQVG